MNSSIAIVLLNYNGQKFLEKFLPSVLASTYVNKKIVVADNASTDNSVSWLKQHYPFVEILVNNKNDGFAGGYNWALQKVEADYFVLLNTDVEVTPNWIEPIIELMNNDKQIAAVQPKILSFENKNQFEYAGAAGGFIDNLGYPFSRGRIFDVCEIDEQQYNTVEKIFWATGAALFISSSAFKQMNGFDEHFFAHMEEIDLCWRLQLAGYAIYVHPKSVVYHVGGGTLPKSYKKTYLNFRNSLVMMCKNLPFTQKIYKIPIRVMLDYVTAIQALVAFNIDMFKAIFHAHFSTINWWFSSKINITNNRKSIEKLEGVYTSSIVWQYFIKKKTKFSQLSFIKNK